MSSIFANINNIHIQIYKGLHIIYILCRYFTSYPDNQNYFRDFRGKPIAELIGTPKLTAHGTNVMCAINGIILQLNEPATLVEVVKKVGYSHGKRQITAQSLQVRTFKISVIIVMPVFKL